MRGFGFRVLEIRRGARQAVAVWMPEKKAVIVAHEARQCCRPDVDKLTSAEGFVCAEGAIDK